MSKRAKQSLEELVLGIRGLHRPLEILGSEFRLALNKLEMHEGRSPTRYSAHYWSLVVVADSLVRVRLLIEQNLNYFETLGVLALTRYVFELMVWVRLVQKDRVFGLMYYRDLADKQRLHYHDLKEHLVAEAAFFKAISEEEEKLLQQRLNYLKQQPDLEAASRLFEEVEQYIDGRVARRLTLFGEQARTNGYDFQASLVETIEIPRAESSLKEVEEELRTIDSALSPQDKKRFGDLQKNCKRRAKLVGMDEEYEFIYSYTSRLLHATATSITTDQKNLELGEIEMFMRYLRISFADLVEIATALLSEATGPEGSNHLTLQ